MEKKVYEVKDLQKVTGLARNTVMSLINSGQIKSVRAGRRILIPSWALDKFLGKNQ